MANSSSIVPSIIAGAIAGALVTLLLARTPAVLPRLTDVNQPSDQHLPAASLPPSADISSHERSIITAVQKAQPAVVSIVITKDVPIIERFYEDIPNPFFGPFGDFFSPFQFRVPSLREQGTQRQEIGGGSGFLISADGMIVTNRHVVDQQGAQYTVFLNDGTKYDAQVVARDPVNDIAILRIQTNNLPFLEFTDSDRLQVGQTVIAIGTALGEFRNTVSVGVISGLSRSIIAGNNLGQSEQLEEVIQTDAAINPGNSGGPLLDLTGKVVGVNVAVALGSENIGFALPANLASSIVESVEQTGKISRPYIGVRYIPITAAIQEANNLSVDYGVLVSPGQSSAELAVMPGSPADKAGIEDGNIILEFDGQRLDANTSLASLVRQKQVGETVRLKVLSQGQERDILLTLDEFPQ
jgi:serine protease Do